MRRRARAALEAGAFGISAGLIYPPGMHAETDELVELTPASIRLRKRFLNESDRRRAARTLAAAES